MTPKAKTSAAPESRDDWLMNTTVLTALGASVSLSAFGVASAFWDGLAAWEPAAIVATASLGAVLGASEVGAVVLARAMVRDGLTVARAGLFAITTIGNVLAAHYGAEAINTRLVEPQRAPYEASVASTAALLDLATTTKADVETRHAREQATLERTFEAERDANPTYVTSRGRQQQEQRDALSTRQRAELAEAQTAIATATTDHRNAEAALAEAPQGFSKLQLWGFAGLMELLKGVLVWVASPRRRRIDAKGNVLPIDPAAYADMDEGELEDILSRGRTASALAQHALKRKRKGAA